MLDGQGFPASSLAIRTVELTVSQMMVERMRAQKDGRDPWVVQREMFGHVTSALLDLVDPVARKALEASWRSPQFSSMASSVWVSPDFIMPVIMGQTVELAGEIGMDEAARIFAVRLDASPAGAFGVVFTSATVISRPDERKAAGLAFAQLVVVATRSVLTSTPAAQIGLMTARRLAGIRDAIAA
ncbi:hypothetical protein Brsp07_04582 [Brucella sp. NBRC 14130]|uniref:hypothetical protein n=1 Tax=Brucella sp. NBRC 14130 TaxID=3075483 RepID=UPI0030ADA789